MKSRISLNIDTAQIIDSESVENQVYSTGNILYEDSENYILSYTQYEDETEKGTVKMKIAVRNGKTVTYTRNGQLATQMSIEENVKNYCDYKTPYGSILMEVTGLRVNSSFDTKKVSGVLEIDYLIDFYTNSVSRNKMKITFSQTKGDNEI